MNEKPQKKPGFGRVFLAIIAIFGALFILSKGPAEQSSAANKSIAPETYRLIQALGNSEHETSRGLTKRECEARKEELKAVSEKLGVTNEKTGRGSITCLPESSFR